MVGDSGHGWWVWYNFVVDDKNGDATDNDEQWPWMMDWVHLCQSSPMSGENKNADVQWLVTLASDGIWPSVTEVGPSVLSPSLCGTVLFSSVYVQCCPSLSPSLCSTVLFHSVHSAVPACAPHAHCLSHSATFPQYASLQPKSPNPGDMYECSAPESQHERPS